MFNGLDSPPVTPLLPVPGHAQPWGNHDDDDLRNSTTDIPLVRSIDYVPHPGGLGTAGKSNSPLGEFRSSVVYDNDNHGSGMRTHAGPERTERAGQVEQAGQTLVVNTVCSDISGSTTTRAASTMGGAKGFNGMVQTKGTGYEYVSQHDVRTL